MATIVPTLIHGEIAADDRGEVRFVNEFSFENIRRFYIVSNHRAGFIRAWHGHQKEEKYVTVVSGAALICAVEIDHWDQPSKNLEVHRFALSAAKPTVLNIPKGYANGSMTLTEDAKIVYFSTATLEESLKDDTRFDSRYWDPWRITER